ncbi:MAG: hypothetical protein U0521_29145 [Anaerolineae bacterium]
MTRLMLKGTAILALLFTATLGAMRAQPYDDGGLWAQLAPSGCPQPCFLGIRPGVTSADDALALLRDNPWVAAITGRDDRKIIWTWNGEQPPFLHAEPEDSRLMLRDGIVHAIGLRTSAQMGDIKIVFGAPDMTYYLNWIMRDSTKNLFSYFELHGVYYDDQFEAAAASVCPLSMIAMWELPVTLALPASTNRSDIFPVVRGAFAGVPKDCR